MIEYYTKDTLDYSIFSKYAIAKKPKGKQYKTSKRYLDVICAFDIETTGLSNIEHSFVYLWQFAIGVDAIVIGRTLDDFIEFLNRIDQVLKPEEWLMIFIHNLSYEFSFLKGIYNFSNDEIFAIDSRKVLKAEMFNRYELRCSYLQTNMSLSELTYKYDVKHKKLPDYEYTKIRYPWSKLSEDELQYGINDVLGLVEAMSKRMRSDNDTPYTLPLTSTGYIRREVKRSLYSFNHYQLKAMMPDLRTYQMLSRAFRGGNTHANRYYSDQTIINANSCDESSAYSYMMMTQLVPMTEFYIEEKKVNIDWVLDLIYQYKKAVTVTIRFYDLELNNKLRGAPYLSRDKCRDIIDGCYDNGRILEGSLTTTLTDIDLRIVLKEYNFTHCEVLECASARYGYLPKQIRDIVLKYYKAKTELKGVKAEEEYYMKAKALLNSIYGLCVQKSIRQPIIYKDGIFEIDNQDEEDLLFKYNRKAFMVYARGVWITAHARYHLEEAIDLAGDNFLYCDTDSCKYIGDIDFSKLNQKRKRIAKQHGAYAKDKYGVTHYMGVFEPEAHMKKFRTLGAKKYCYEDDSGKLHLTLAGVHKIKGAEELEKHGGIEAFKEGMIFKDAGGSEAVYNDNIDMIIKVGKREIHIRDNLYIKPSVYTLGMTEEYIDLLKDSELWLEVFKKEML